MTIIQTDSRNRVRMIGLDFGSTTSSALIAEASVGRSSLTGRMAFGSPEVVFRSPVVFTPFSGEQIDGEGIEACLDRWLEGDQDLFSGGVIITGMAALRRNASAIADRVKQRIGQAVIATVDDPNLESWLAFMGCAATLSRHYRDRVLVNLDIGGGTTNPAAGQAGQVVSTGCFYVGARHFQFTPGTYTLTRTSEYGRAVMEEIGVSRTPGESLSPEEVEKILSLYIRALRAMVCGDTDYFARGLGSRLCQARFDLARDAAPLVTFSGGVGELAYSLANGGSPPGRTCYGDLGVDLARALVADSFFGDQIRRCQPENMGRATVYGLTLHNTEISGVTNYIPDPSVLPLTDIPIVARLPLDCGAEPLTRAVGMVRSRGGKACIQMVASPAGKDAGLQDLPDLARIKTLGQDIKEAMTSLSPDMPLVIMVPGNFGKALGNYATDWGTAPSSLVVLDEIPDRNAQFVNIGSPGRGVVPVSFYGIY